MHATRSLRSLVLNRCSHSFTFIFITQALQSHVLFNTRVVSCVTHSYLLSLSHKSYLYLTHVYHVGDNRRYSFVSFGQRQQFFTMLTPILLCLHGDCGALLWRTVYTAWPSLYEIFHLLRGILPVIPVGYLTTFGTLSRATFRPNGRSTVRSHGSEFAYAISSQQPNHSARIRCDSLSNTQRIFNSLW